LPSRKKKAGKEESGVKSKGRVAQMGSFQKKIVPELAMMW
jgi:hypothetical protein